MNPVTMKQPVMPNLLAAGKSRNSFPEREVGCGIAGVSCSNSLPAFGFDTLGVKYFIGARMVDMAG